MITVIFSSYGGFAESFYWFTTMHIGLNIVIGICVMLASGYIYGGFAGKQILLNKRNWILAGSLCGITVLLTTAFLCGWTGFFQEGIKNLGTNDDPFEDYIFKPFFWIATFGIIPAILVGIWYGWRIKRLGASDAQA